MNGKNIIRLLQKEHMVLGTLLQKNIGEKIYFFQLSYVLEPDHFKTNEALEIDIHFFQASKVS